MRRFWCWCCVRSAAANWLAPAGYSRQYREAADAAPSRTHWLGTDEIGRDRFARVLYGTRISLLLAPAAALLSTLDGGFRWRAGGISRRRVGADGDGGDRSFLVAAVAFFADHSARVDAAERFSTDFGVGDFSDVGSAGVDERGARALRNCRRLCATPISCARRGRLGFRHNGCSGCMCCRI